jgi:hypothetical protein
MNRSAQMMLPATLSTVCFSYAQAKGFRWNDFGPRTLNEMVKINNDEKVVA